jgi:pimeloyl-ACP methyl ester carboxylesterase
LPAYRPSRLLVALLAAVTAIAAVIALAVSQPGAARAAVVKPAAAAGNSGPKPTIVLEHGAWADNSSWDAMVGLLQRLGYTVDALPNPLRSVQYDTAYLQDFLKTIKGPIVLVGHSYGSFVMTNAQRAQHGDLTFTAAQGGVGEGDADKTLAAAHRAPLLREDEPDQVRRLSRSRPGGTSKSVTSQCKPPRVLEPRGTGQVVASSRATASSASAGTGSAAGASGTAGRAPSASYRRTSRGST